MKNYKKYTYRSGMAISPLILSACGGSTLLSNSSPVDDQFDIFNINLTSEIAVAENTDFKFEAPQIIDGVPLGEITYSISGLDSDQFSVNIKSGVVSLKSQDFENMVDADQNNSYVIELIATDQRGTTTTKLIEVNVKDVIEIANFQLNGQGEHSVLENQSFTGNTPQIAGEAPIGTLTYSMSGVDADLFEIDTLTGVVKLSSKDFENALDNGENNIYNYTITATDSDGNASVQDFSLAVQDQAFVIEANESIKIAENDNFTSESPTMAGDAPIGSVTYSISGADASKFVINSSTGIVTMNAKNYENATDVGTNNIYDYTINAIDEAGNVATKDISVEVEDANEVANFTIDNSLGNSSVGENSHYTSSAPSTTGDTPIGNLTYSLSGADATKFVINSSTGVVTMTAKDYENASDTGTNNIYDYTIKATDEDGNIASKDISVEVGDVTEVANFTISNSLGNSSVSENSHYTSSAPSTTGDTPIGNLTYSLSGADATKFVINSSTGVVTMTAKDYENASDTGTNNIYDYTIKATDEDGNIATRNIAVSIENEASEIGGITDSDTYENWNYVSRTPTITNDAPSGFVNYTLSGSDASHFSVNGTTGIVTMSAKNYENAIDSNADNEYDYTLVRTDSANTVVSKDITVTVLNLNEAPTITSTANTTATEGSAYSYTFAASDVDANDTLTYSTSTLPSWLNFNATTGVLLGTPGEADAGLSSITLTATDAAGLTATQTMKLSTTTGSVSVGGSHTGTLGVTGDKDWIAVELTQGQAYGVSLSGNSGSYVSDAIEDPDHDPSILNCGCPSCIGSVKQEVEGSEIEAALIDPYVYVYDKDGNLIKSDDDSGSGRDSYLTFTPTYTGTYYVEARAWNDNYTGDYKIEVSEVIPPRPTGALEWGNAAWDTSQTIDVYFADNGVTVSDGTTSTGFTDAEETSMMGMLSNVTNFANISFQKTEVQADADIRFAHANLGGGLLGYMFPQNYNSNEGLGVLTNNSSYWNDTSMQVGGFMYGVVVHEIGHGLGLAHPHDTGGGSQVMDGVSSSSDKGDYGQMNQSVYTVMSYNEGFAAHPLGLPSDYGSGHMGSFAALDIAVLQSYYGANTSYNNGSTTYSLGSKDYYEAIWDGGGTDEITMSGSSNAVIDLRAATLEYETGGAGFVSYNANAKGGYTIANGVVIENAKGGGGTDTIIGNDANNIIYGGSGAGVKDTLTGNGGIDTFVCIAADASTGANTTDHITDFTDGTDLIGIDNGLSFSDLTFSQNGHATQIVNTSANKLLFLLDNFTYSNLTADDFVQIDFI